MEIIIGWTQSAIMLSGFIIVFLQFRKQIQAIEKDHDWNRRKTSQEACYKFLETETVNSWKAIRNRIGIEGKKYDDLTEDEKGQLLTVLYYFENLGISIKNNILVEDIIYDFFGYIWPVCFRASEQFIQHDQQERNDESLYEHVIEYAERFKQRAIEIKDRRQSAGKIPGKDAL